jgi:hypothetical protein
MSTLSLNPTRRARGHFATDCLPIVAACQSDAEIFTRAAQFVIATIRFPFQSVPMAMADIDALGQESRFVYGWKRDSLRYIAEHKSELHASARACAKGKLSLDSLLLAFLAVPGLGIVKASFLAQLSVGNGACIDAHNLRAMGLSETAFRLSKALTVRTVQQRIAAYNGAWRAIGDSAHWWNVWCDNLATLRAAHFADGAHVSRLHREIILGKE